MRVERAGPRLLLMHGEDLIAEAQKTVVELAIPECPSLHEARRASAGYPGLDRHPFPGCFVCGPQRAADGMAVFPGPLTDGRAWAAVWSAAETAGAGPADVLVWAAMDCPGGWSISATDPAATYVLGRMAGQRIRPLDAAPVISLAWLIGPMSRTTFTNRPQSNLTSVRRPTVMVYAGLAYAAFAAAALWAIAFLADLSTPHAVDGASRRPAWAALLIDACLLLVFAVQHSVMARAGFKQRLARILPAATERSTYVLAASLALGLLFWQWQPLPASAWRVGAQPWAALIWVVYAAGWLLVVATTFMIDHLDFLGLRQAYAHTRQRPYQPPSFTERWLYAWMRHPMMLGLIIAFRATPVMTAGHLLFAAAGSAYIIVGLEFEERDLTRHLGPAYRDYAQRVPALIPAPHRVLARRNRQAARRRS